MAFTIPSNDVAAYKDQSRWYKTDVDALTAAIASISGVLVGCEVSASGLPDMNVDLNPGQVRSAGTLVVTNGGTLTVAAADSTNPRFDLVLYLPETGAIEVVTGTPAVKPKTGDINPGEVYIAQIYVPAGATAITNSLIVDKRCILSDQRWEVLMAPGISFPPDPLESPLGGDWLYAQTPQPIAVS